MKICIFGASSTTIEQKYIDLGYELGREIAKQGHSLIFGGGKDGMMGAVARGVAAENGEIISIYPEWIKNYQDVFEDATQTIFTENLNDRKKIFFEKADALILTPGGIGSLDEFFEAITLKTLNRYDGNIVVYNMYSYYDKMLDMVEEMIDEDYVSNEFNEDIIVTDNIEDTVRMC